MRFVKSFPLLLTTVGDLNFPLFLGWNHYPSVRQCHPARKNAAIVRQAVDRLCCALRELPAALRQALPAEKSLRNHPQSPTHYCRRPSVHIAMPHADVSAKDAKKLERKASKAAAKKAAASATPDGTPAIARDEDFTAELATVKEKREKTDNKKKSSKKHKGAGHDEAVLDGSDGVKKVVKDEEMPDAPPAAAEKAKVSKKEKKKDKKEKKAGKSAEAAELSPSSKKRKRGHELPEDELEIDVSLPEPPSKKALRKLKKSKSKPESTKDSKKKLRKAVSTLEDSDAEDELKTYPEHASQSRSKYGVWIGNLTYVTTREQIEGFLTQDDSPITKEHITRINLPLKNPHANRGFCYVDFSTKEATDHAISLSESKLNGRNLLIKSATDFSNRNASASASTPDAPKVRLGANMTKKPPSQILFVGNLDFSTTPEDLKRHFAFAGHIARVRLTTFEDSGKCKGFGFVDFNDVASVTRAMKGLSEEEEARLDEVEGREEVELAKLRRRRAILGTRPLVMEYGEDPATRYKKRFGKDRPRDGEEGAGGEEEEEAAVPSAVAKARGVADMVRGDRKPRRDTRSSDPGAAYSSDVRRTGGITASKGKRKTFDEDE